MSPLMRRIITAAVTLAFALVLMPEGTAAQEQPQQPAPQQQELPDAPDSEELVQFTEAMLDIGGVEQDMQQALAAVDDPEQANQIQQQANAQMESVLDEHDLSAERYSEIAMVLETDPEMNAQFQEVLEEILEEREREGGQPGPM